MSVKEEVLLSEADTTVSLDFIGKTAFVITLTGKVIRIDNAGEPPFGQLH
jgi:hypothetical protein